MWSCLQNSKSNIFNAISYHHSVFLLPLSFHFSVSGGHEVAPHFLGGWGGVYNKVDLFWIYLDTSWWLAVNFSVYFSSVQFSHVWLFATPWTIAHQASLSITNSQSLLKLMSIKSVMPSNHLILCHFLLLQTSVFRSIRVFSSESVPRSRCPDYWHFSFSISPSNEYSGLISFRIDWVDLLAVRSLLQLHYTVHGLLQAIILGWRAFPSSRGSSQPRSPTLKGNLYQLSHKGSPSVYLCYC